MVHAVTEEIDDGDEFEFGMGFAAAACPACDMVAEPGECPNCGGDVPAPDELNEATTARRETLLLLRAQAELVLEGLHDLPEPRIPIASTVLLSGFLEAELFDRVLSIVSLGRELAQFDLDDEDTIRGPLRDAAEQRVTVAKNIGSACHDISLFQATAPADRLPEIAADLGRQGARLLVAFLAALTAVDLGAAREAQAAIQAELNSVPTGAQLSEVLGELDGMAAGIDQRIGVALAREGPFTDPYGAIDLARVLWAFRDAGDPLLAVGRRAAQYFQPLVAADLDKDDGPQTVLLALPLLQVVAMDHPLLAHRMVRETHELFALAAAVDRDALDAVRRDLAARGDALLAAHERTRAAALELAASDVELDASLLDRLLALYRDACDDLWEPYAGVLDQMTTIAGASLAPAQATFRAAVKPTLREPSAGFTWVMVDEEVHVLHEDSGQSWSIDDYASEIDRVLSAVAGTDAGCCLGILSENLVTPDEPVGRAGRSLLVQTLVGPAGATLVDMADDASEITVAPLSDGYDVQRLISATAGLVAAFPGTEHFTVRDERGSSIVEMTAATMRRAQEASYVLRDLAVVAACHESRVARGESAAMVTRHLAAVQTYVAATAALRAFAEPSLRTLAHIELAEQLGFISTYARRNGERKLAERIGRARASSAIAARGDWAAHRRAVDQLTALASWALSAGAALRWL
jgi:hypothetical protein